MLLNELGNFTTFRIYHVPYSIKKGHKVPTREEVQIVPICPRPGQTCATYTTLLGGIPWVEFTHEKNPTNSRDEAYELKRTLVGMGFSPKDVVVVMEHPTEFFIKGW
jgi:hypothetical protein